MFDIDFNLVYKGILSSKRKDSIYKKATIRRIDMQDSEFFQIELSTETQVFHYNYKIDDAKEKIEEFFENYFYQASFFTNEYVYNYRMTDKGHLLSNRKKENSNFLVVPHNKKKNYILEEGMVIEPLIDLNVMQENGKINKAYFEKFRQINNFLLILDETLKDFKGNEINIIDFGCGKSYLTFIVYYYFQNIRKIKSNILGLDLKKDVIEKCNQIKDKYHYDNLRFECGDIAKYKNTKCDMIITLHACDVATDFALYNAIEMNAKYILSVPCCQHEINLSIKKNTFELINKYGILKERFSSILTDSIRANLLEYKGYDVKLLEFIDFEGSPKNIMIRALKTGKENKESLKLVEDILAQYNIKQTLHDLLMK